MEVQNVRVPSNPGVTSTITNPPLKIDGGGAWLPGLRAEFSHPLQLNPPEQNFVLQ